MVLPTSVVSGDSLGGAVAMSAAGRSRNDSASVAYARSEFTSRRSASSPPHESSTNPARLDGSTSRADWWMRLTVVQWSITGWFTSASSPRGLEPRRCGAPLPSSLLEGAIRPVKLSCRRRAWSQGDGSALEQTYGTRPPPQIPDCPCPLGRPQFHSYEALVEPRIRAEAVPLRPDREINDRKVASVD